MGLENTKNTKSRGFHLSDQFSTSHLSLGCRIMISFVEWQYYFYLQALTGGEKPPQLVKIAATRWLSWYKAVKSHCEKQSQLKTLFRKVANEVGQDKCPMASQLPKLHEDGIDLLYITFLRPILSELASINVAFQSSVADVSKAFSDLRTFVFWIAESFLKREALAQGTPGMLRA